MCDKQSINPNKKCIKNLGKREKNSEINIETIIEFTILRCWNILYVKFLCELEFTITFLKIIL